MKPFDKRKQKRDLGSRYYWWATYFNARITFKCYNCGKSCNSYFCSTDCSSKFMKKNNILKLIVIRSKISGLQSYIKNKPVWSNDWKRQIPMTDMDYHERITNYSYDFAMTKIDNLCKKFNDILKKTNIYKRFNSDC